MDIKVGTRNTGPLPPLAPPAQKAPGAQPPAKPAAPQAASTEGTWKGQVKKAVTGSLGPLPWAGNAKPLIPTDPAPKGTKRDNSSDQGGTSGTITTPGRSRR